MSSGSSRVRRFAAGPDRISGYTKWRLPEGAGSARSNISGGAYAGVLCFTVIVLTAACIVLPLMLARPPEPRDFSRGANGEDRTNAGIAWHVLYFAAIGFGFMLVEISQVQRLAIFLGHPVYSLSVVLFSLLLSSGIGSLSTARLSDRQRASTTVLLLLVTVLVTFGGVTPLVITHFEAASTATRIAVSIAILLPIGFFMGMAFPIGMRQALTQVPSIAPWLWGVNGAASVCASVLVVVIALGAGISAAFWIGTGCYVIALAGVLRWRRSA